MRNNDIKKVAEDYKEQNGNKNITTKELLWYVIKRLDDMDKRDAEQDNRISKVETKAKMLCWIIPVLISIIALMMVS